MAKSQLSGVNSNCVINDLSRHPVPASCAEAFPIKAADLEPPGRGSVGHRP
jgi:hypothetical protein